MKRLKKFALLGCILLMAGSLSVATACKDEPTSSSAPTSSVEQSVTSSSEESSSSTETSTSETPPVTSEDSSSSSSTETSTPETSSPEDSSSSSEPEDSSSSSEPEEEPFVPIYPEGTPTSWKTPKSGNGGEYKTRFACDEGYYELTLNKANQEYFFSFSVAQSGQYALYSVERAKYVTVTRYAASSDYITRPGTEAMALEGDHFYSVVNCSNKEFSTEWRATFGIKAAANNKTIKVRFVRIADPVKEPETLVTDVTATEIKGVAPDGASGTTPTLVPWTSEDNVSYFYDENYEMQVTPIGGGTPLTVKGFYRMGTAANPGEVIWVKITTVPDRLFTTTFNEVYYTAQGLARVYTGKDADGNYLVNNYVDFIMNNGGNMVGDQSGQLVPATGDTSKACYANAVNADGMYPVNRELHEFLKLYTQNNPPFVDEGVTVANEDKWLAPCYYYAELVAGSKENPIELQIGENTITTAAKASSYYTMKGAAGTTYTVTTTSTDLILVFNKVNYGGANGFTVHFETDTAGKLLEFKSKNGGSFTVTVMQTHGTPENPVPLTTLEPTTLQTQKIILLDGDFLYQNVYAYTFTQSGTLTITTQANVSIIVDNATLEAGTLTTEITLGDGETETQVQILISANAEATAQVTFTFTPAA